MFVSGCTTHVTVDPFVMPEAHGAKIPAKVGVYYAPEFRTHEIREQLQDDMESMQLETDIGPASVSMIGSTLHSAFAGVLEVQSIDPPELSSGEIEAVITPRITDFGYLQTGGGGTIVEIGYELSITDAESRTVVLVSDARFDELADTMSFKFELISSGAPRRISAAMRDAGTALWFQLNAVAQEDDWLLALARRNVENLAEIERAFAVPEGQCSVFLYISEHSAYYPQSSVEDMGGVTLSIDDREVTLPSTSEYVRFDLEAGLHNIVYGESYIVGMLPLETSLTPSINFDCVAGESTVFELVFVGAVEVTHREVKSDYGLQRIELRTRVAGDHPSEQM